MGIEGRSLAQVARQFKEHLDEVLAKTITQRPLVAIGARNPHTKSEQMVLAFRQGGRPTAVPMDTNRGTLYLSLAQRCETEVKDGRERLLTAEYRYTLSLDPDLEPLLRWEYVRVRPPSTDDKPAPKWCRHHLQGTSQVDFGRGLESLNPLHLPTGYVLVEDAIRFLLNDLGVPALSAAWSDVLDESYRKFREEFRT